MALTLPQIVYGFQVYASGSSQNNKLDFKDNGTTYAATLSAGVYTADEFAAEVQRAMRAATGNSNQVVSFNYDDATVSSVPSLSFRLSGTAVFQLLFGTGTNHATDCNGLLGFQDDGTSGTDKTGAAAYNSTSAVGGTYSTASVWTLAEPVQNNSPMTAQAAGDINGTATAALLTQRIPRIVQNVSDGATVESVYFSTLKRVLITFDQLVAAEQTKMESFLNWAVQGRRFTYQPDSTSPNALKLVMDVKDVQNAFSWLTRPETSYGQFAFFEQLT